MQLLTFLLNGVKFGIPVNDVESIETRMNVVNIPNSLPQVHGIMNLHGEVIAVSFSCHCVRSKPVQNNYSSCLQM
jgi:purine-binding chemotaxis protein CheW